MPDETIDVSPLRAQSNSRQDVDLRLARAMAMVELLVAEATMRFRSHADSKARANAATSELVAGVMTALGPRMPPSLERALPRFAKEIDRLSRRRTPEMSRSSKIAGKVSNAVTALRPQS